MRATSLAFAIPIILGIGLPLGTPPLLTEPAAGQEQPAPPDPTWQRLGLPESPTPESGRGVGIVVMDDDGLHPALRHLGERLKHVTVAQDMSVSLVEPLKAYKDREDAEYTHGVRTLLQMASAPFRVRDRTYSGLAPGATYFVISLPSFMTQSDGRDGAALSLGPPAGSRPRVGRGEPRAMEHPGHPSLTIVLRPAAPAGRPTCGRAEQEYPGLSRWSSALEPALKAGILVVNGQRQHEHREQLPPGRIPRRRRLPRCGACRSPIPPREPRRALGRNSDGHLRPDLLAPKYFVPNHRTPEGELAYFGGTSSASAQITALCALLFARFPQADAQTIKNALIRSGDPLPGAGGPGCASTRPVPSNC